MLVCSTLAKDRTVEFLHEASCDSLYIIAANRVLMPAMGGLMHDLLLERERECEGVVAIEATQPCPCGCLLADLRGLIAC